jgi:hypothetical protein
MENNDHDDILKPEGSGDDTLLARWLAGDLSQEDLEALRNLEEYPDYVEMLHVLEGMELPEFSPTLAWQRLQPVLEKEKAEKAAIDRAQQGHPDEERNGMAEGSEQSEPKANEEVAVQPTTPEPVAQHEAKIVEIGAKQVANPNLPSVNRQPSIVNRKWLAIAAAVLLGVVGIWWLASPGEDQSIVTQAGEQREVKLPDGSIASIFLQKPGLMTAMWCWKARRISRQKKARPSPFAASRARWR